MAINKTLRHVDTCGCGFTYTWDTEVENPPHTFAELVDVCPAHASLPGPLLFDTVVDECARKNTTETIAQALRPELQPQNIPHMFTGTGVDRVLHIAFLPNNLRDSEKATIQAEVDIQFGPGKVMVE